MNEKVKVAIQHGNDVNVLEGRAVFAVVIQDGGGGADVQCKSVVLVNGRTNAEEAAQILGTAAGSIIKRLAAENDDEAEAYVRMTRAAMDTIFTDDGDDFPV